MERLGRFRWAILGAVAVALIALSVVTGQWGGDDATIEAAGQLGPTPGPDASGYVDDKIAYLDGLDPGTEAASLVSFSRLLRPSEVAEATDRAPLEAVFVRFPSGETEALQATGTVEATVGARAMELLEAREAEVAALEAEAATVEGEDRQELLRRAGEVRRWITQIRGGCACVYAAVLGARPLSALEAIQSRDEVRLVDVPDPIVESLRGWDLTPILPS